MHQAMSLCFACRNFEKLSSNAKKRLAVENDDKATQWSVSDLLQLHDRIGESSNVAMYDLL